MANLALQMNDETIARAAEVVGEGGLVAYPTDTVYGLGCDPFSPAAVDRLFEAKGRGSKPIPILCDSIDSVGRLVSLNTTALSLAKATWPGALTIVAPAVRRVPHRVDQGSGEIGVRIPALRVCLRLITACGGYLAGTSANISGKQPCRAAQEVILTLGQRVDVVLDGGRTSGIGSTVVRVRGDNIEMLREGPVKLQGAFKGV